VEADLPLLCNVITWGKGGIIIKDGGYRLLISSTLSLVVAENLMLCCWPRKRDVVRSLPVSFFFSAVMFVALKEKDPFLKLEPDRSHVVPVGLCFALFFASSIAF